MILTYVVPLSYILVRWVQIPFPLLDETIQESRNYLALYVLSEKLYQNVNQRVSGMIM